MYTAVPAGRSCVESWLSAAHAIQTEGEGYNVIIDVERPTEFNTGDNAAAKLVDQFLRTHDQNPLSTVANTIFPQALYEEHGAPAFYSEYLAVFDSLSRPGWGRYFERMTRHKRMDGIEYNPLQVLVERLAGRQEKQQYTSAYELAIYDPLQDGRVFRGGQCLSFLSFKLHPTRGICLTAIYRNHTYITRCLGNLIGLGRLQAFVAKESGYPLGSLTCISTHAELDTVQGAWSLRDARALVKSAYQVWAEQRPGAQPTSQI